MKKVPVQAKADLHLHSKYSDRPSEWLLRRIGAPESFTQPEELYRICKQRGMDFVTISDHNCIDGALDIAHHPDTFISCEVTTYFPEDGCKIHLLVTGITPQQFEIIDQARENIYDLQRYLVQEDIVHSIAHTLFTVNGRMTIDHIEKLLLLFKRFEGLNGTNNRRADHLVDVIFRGLTPQIIEQMADRQGLPPQGNEPWRKYFTGGSDDHSGLYLANAYTVTPPAADVHEFLGHLRRGEHEMAGISGASLRVAHGFYQIGYSYYRNRFLGSSAPASGLVAQFVKRYVAQPSTRKFTVGKRVRNMAWGVINTIRWRRLSDVDRLLLQEFSHFLVQGGGQAYLTDPVGQDPAFDQRNFETVCRLCHQVAYVFLERFITEVKRGNFMLSLQSLASLGPVAMSVAPYIAAFRTLHKDEKLMRQVAEHFGVAEQVYVGDHKKLWVTDHCDPADGLTRLMQRLGALAAQKGRSLAVLTCMEQAPRLEMEVKNFPPVGQFAMPDLGFDNLAFPPFLEIIKHIEDAGYSELIMSAPDTLGLTALAAGKMLGLRLTGVYHADLAHHAQQGTEDEVMAGLVRKYTLWFMAQMDRVLVPSASDRRRLIELGVAEDKIHVLPDAVDARRFRPDLRDERFWLRHGVPQGFKFLCVGNFARQDHVHRLLQAFASLSSVGKPAHLVVVGAGPVLKELRKHHRPPHVTFVDQLDEDDLARAYASADALVFPSAADSMGHVVLEAQASGLPVIVPQSLGLAEMVQRVGSGLVINPAASDALSGAMAELLGDPARCAAMREQAPKLAGNADWNAVLDTLWNMPTKVALPAPRRPAARPEPELAPV